MTGLQRRHRRFSALLWFVTILIFSTTPVLAQLSTASLNGVVRDSTGAVVPKASVILHNADTGVDRDSSTNDAGAYVLTNINRGRYPLKVSAPSFSTKQIAEFVLAVNQTATIDISLAAGSQTEVVSVEAQAEQLQV